MCVCTARFSYYFFKKDSVTWGSSSSYLILVSQVYIWQNELKSPYARISKNEWISLSNINMIFNLNKKNRLQEGKLEEARSDWKDIASVGILRGFARISRTIYTSLILQDKGYERMHIWLRSCSVYVQCMRYGKLKEK